MKMFSYIYSLVYGEDEVKADEKQLRQKYLVLLQIKDHRIKLKSIEKKKPMKVMCSYKKKVLP
jgi:hypothetical protein